MKLYGVKYREKGEKKYQSIIIPAENESHVSDIVKGILEEYPEIDKRTVSWAGNSIPLAQSNVPIMVDGDLDEMVYSL